MFRRRPGSTDALESGAARRSILPDGIVRQIDSLEPGSCLLQRTFGHRDKRTRALGLASSAKVHGRGKDKYPAAHYPSFPADCLGSSAADGSNQTGSENSSETWMMSRKNLPASCSRIEVF